MNNILVFGHKKPDTDSVTSAISLSYLKNKLGFNTEPRILGDINNETKFVLNYFKTETPKYLNDIKLQIKDVNYSKNIKIDQYDSVFKSYNYMHNKKISTLPIVNENNEYLGATSMKDIARDTIEGNFESLCTSYQNILDALDAKEITKYNDEISGEILIASYRSTTFIENVKLKPNTILIVGDRHSIIEYAVNEKIKLIILTGDSQIKKEHLALAKKNKVNIIATSHDTFNVAKKIGLCNYISKINFDKNVTYVYESDDLKDFIELANRTKYSNYPVINKNNKCLGIISLAEASEKNKTKVILVDHNEAEQSVDNLEDGEIIEIIDHHKIGVLGTKIPINFRNMPLGSTNSIIYMMYQENNIEIPKQICGLMMSGILSDTLLFKSPTTTKTDKEIVKALSEKLKINYTDFAMEMFKEGSKMSHKSPEEILYSDFKNFSIEGKRVGISQVSTVNPEDILNNKQTYIDLLNKIEKDHNYYILALFITDIINDCSYCLYNEDSKDILEASFDRTFNQGICMPDVLSRKKQIIPRIMNTLEKK